VLDSDIEALAMRVRSSAQWQPLGDGEPVLAAKG
jgi:hypothetical protein